MTNPVIVYPIAHHISLTQWVQLVCIPKSSSFDVFPLQPCRLFHRCPYRRAQCRFSTQRHVTRPPFGNIQTSFTPFDGTTFASITLASPYLRFPPYSPLFSVRPSVRAHIHPHSVVRIFISCHTMPLSQWESHEIGYVVCWCGWDKRKWRSHLMAKSLFYFSSFCVLLFVANDTDVFACDCVVLGCFVSFCPVSSSCSPYFFYGLSFWHPVRCATRQSAMAMRRLYRAPRTILRVFYFYLTWDEKHYLLPV